MKLEKYLLDFGYNQNEIEKILSEYPLCRRTEDSLLKNIIGINELLISLGYTKSSIKKMANSCPRLYTFTVQNINQKFNSFIILGYPKKRYNENDKITLNALYNWY